jgi:hypothetical protein
MPAADRPANNASYLLHVRRHPACLQQGADVVWIAGQHHVRGRSQERHMRVNDVSRTSACEQFAYSLAVVLAQFFDADTGQHARKIGLLAAIPPNLANNRSAYPHRRPPLLEHAQLGAYCPITTVNRDKCSGVKYCLHATSG